MPRLITSANEPLDFCITCFAQLCPNEYTARRKYGSDSMLFGGNCFSFDVSHPLYEKKIQHCHNCKKELTAVDNY
jgi:predicted sulfurtransferase